MAIKKIGEFLKDSDNNDFYVELNNTGDVVISDLDGNNIIVFKDKEDLETLNKVILSLLNNS